MKTQYSLMKFKFVFSLLSLVIFLLTSCENPSVKENVSSQPIDKELIKDGHSYSNIDKVNTKHLHLDLDVNFENKTIYGVARHEIENTKGVDTVIFDIKALEIQKVTLGKKGNEIETDFIIGQNDALLGQPLLVKIKKTTQLVNIYYKTTEKTEALDWLDAKLTNGKKSPLMYSQGQAILTRSWIPVQDAPSNRITYSADVKVPVELMAVMSAKNATKRDTSGIYHFDMKQPIPCYLIAITVGNLAYRKLGKNCGVFSEPELIRNCAYEFVDLPKMIAAAEKIYGKYQWEQYDIVVLPYSFPFGGMENPRLTFANPTLLAGDRSLVSVIAHELAHSWSGNLVTNATWDDFWLNEGFTVYFENRIMEEIYGVETANMLAIIEFQELENELKQIQKSQHPEDSKLKLSLNGRSPDDGMTSIAYVKGAFFLKTLEQKVGRTAFDNFLKSYFKKFAFKTITTEGFEEFLNQKLLTKTKFNTKEWLYEEGIPSNCIQLTSKRFDDVRRLADKFVSGENIFKVKKKKNKITRDKFITQEWLEFIRHLPKKMDPNRMALIDKHLNFKGCGNAEIMTEWYLLGINSGYKAIRPEMKRFLCKVGRRKFLSPIYDALSKNPDDLKWAKMVFIRANMGYHYVSYTTIEEILYPGEESSYTIQ